jgi:hypothetical protein
MAAKRILLISNSTRYGRGFLDRELRELPRAKRARDLAVKVSRSKRAWGTNSSRRAGAVRGDA